MSLADNKPATAAKQDTANAKLDQVTSAVVALATGKSDDPAFGVQPGLEWVDVTIASLSSGQAAGVAAVLSGNADRKGLMINPPVDCLLKIATADDAGGWPLYGGVPNSIVGQSCPTNALYLTGLSAGQAVAIWEA